MLLLDDLKTRDSLNRMVEKASKDAGRALSQILSKQVVVNSKEVKVKKLSELIDKDYQDNEVVVATLIRVMGEIPGSILMLVREEEAVKMSSVLLSKLMENWDYEMSMSVFQEMGNILGNTYLNSIGEILDIQMLGSVPYVSIDEVSAIVTSAYMAANVTEDVIIDMGGILKDEESDLEIKVCFIAKNDDIVAIGQKIQQKNI